MARISIAATGDSVLLTRLPGGYDGFEPVSRFIRTADARITNLETVISNFEHFPSAFSGGTWINAEPDKLYELLSFGFNMLGWANNHTLDYSYGGLISTKRELDKSGVAHAGAGMDLDEASRPAVLDLPNARLGMISICSTFNDAARAGEKSKAQPGRPGLNPLRFETEYHVSKEHMRALMEIAETTRLNGGNDALRRDGFLPEPPEGGFYFGSTLFREGLPERKATRVNRIDMERTRKTIADALNLTDYVVVLAHSHEIKAADYHEPDEFFIDFCRGCIDAGACAVIGSGTHQLKPLEIYKNRPIFYSLGNFIFQTDMIKLLPPDFCEKYGVDINSTAAEALKARSKNGTRGLYTDFKNFRSVIPYFEFEGDKLTRLNLMPIELGLGKEKDLVGLPCPADDKASREIYSWYKEISRPYGTEMTIHNGIIDVKL